MQLASPFFVSCFWLFQRNDDFRKVYMYRFSQNFVSNVVGDKLAVVDGTKRRQLQSLDQFWLSVKTDGSKWPTRKRMKPLCQARAVLRTVMLK